MEVINEFLDSLIPDILNKLAERFSSYIDHIRTFESILGNEIKERDENAFMEVESKFIKYKENKKMKYDSHYDCLFDWFLYKQGFLWGLIRISQDFGLKKLLSAFEKLALSRHLALEGTKQKISQGPYIYGLNLTGSNSIIIPFKSPEQYSNDLIVMKKTSNECDLVDRLYCITHFEAKKWLEIARDMGDKRVEQDIKPVYAYIGDLKSLGKKTWNTGDDLCFKIIEELFDTGDLENLKFREFDLFTLFMNSINQLKTFERDETGIYLKLLERLESNDENINHEEIINILPYFMHEFEYRNQIPLLARTLHPVFLSDAAYWLINGPAVAYRYGIFILNYLEENKLSIPKTWKILSNIYFFGFSEERDKYHPEGRSLSESKEKAKFYSTKLYKSGSLDYYGEIEDPSLDYIKFKAHWDSFGLSEIRKGYIMHLWKNKTDLFSNTIYNSEAFNDHQKIRILLDFDGPSKHYTQEILGKLFLKTNNYSMAKKYLKLSKDQGNHYASYMYDGLCLVSSINYEDSKTEYVPLTDDERKEYITLFFDDYKKRYADD